MLQCSRLSCSTPSTHVLVKPAKDSQLSSFCLFWFNYTLILPIIKLAPAVGTIRNDSDLMMIVDSSGLSKQVPHTRRIYQQQPGGIDALAGGQRSAAAEVIIISDPGFTSLMNNRSWLFTEAQRSGRMFFSWVAGIKTFVVAEVTSTLLHLHSSYSPSRGPTPSVSASLGPFVDGLLGV